MQHNGQAGQDRFVLECTGFKTNGTFLEIGSHDPVFINNTYLLESKYGWRGIMVEMDEQYTKEYKTKRPNSVHLIKDATKINYAEEFQNANMPPIVDYLQIDLEVYNRSTLTTLELVENQLLKNYTFATVTFEHDIWRGDFFNTRAISRAIFERYGYVRVVSDVCNGKAAFEDWWVHPSAIDMTNVECLSGLQDGLEYTDVIARFPVRN
jgi:hypothetical protein